MNKFLTTLALCALTLAVKAQQATTLNQEYGKIDQADLEMKACDFEKDANAEVLIDKGDLYYDQTFNVVLEVHRRIKIFNDNGKSNADIVIPFDGGDRSEFITGLQAETVNLVDGKVEITKLDKKQVYIKNIDKVKSEMIFTFPNVKSGSIIEYKYVWNGVDYGYVPSWSYQEDIPVRYSELDTKLPDLLYFNTRVKSLLRLTKYSTSQESGSIGIGQDAVSYTNECAKREMDNIPSLNDEPYMSSKTDNQASISFILTSIKPINGFVKSRADTWAKIGSVLADDDDFGHQLKRKLAGEDVIISQAKALKTDDEKIAFLFNKVKTTMKWNDEDRWYTNVGTSSAWDTKTGNATEINLILYHLLKKSGVAAMPMIVSTRGHGRANPSFPYLGQFNRAVVYIPVDSTKLYVLDASNKYNMYNEIPYNLLNSSGFYVDIDNKTEDLVFLQKQTPIRESIFITAEIKPEGKIEGNAEISSLSYNRMSDIDDYNTEGEKKYIDNLREDDNNLKISSLKMDNMDVDSLPLVQNIKFNLDLTGSDDNYIYFNSNLFSSLHKNPFLNETRSSDIDFGYPSTLTINGIYKEPAGYKVDALPKNISMTMPDRGITFKRIIGEQDGTIVVRYVVTYNKSIYFKENYADFHEFFKQLFQMLNEPIALKKS
ncbi:DUF3857 domain-containing protein [Mucilaginibacter sp. L196]|uniref:DUF3857 domain-containing protein n=1 Tax=Mucilaginibacter sp. L196 TaxID=1641870 RepID=UPI00131B4926|nr:DUF3857 domain-containing protein [Mucilaginibacter sp. L196]